jgi:mRNA-degrading endonuclease HigB of HigAB toxin-antitoxin module
MRRTLISLGHHHTAASTTYRYVFPTRLLAVEPSESRIRAWLAIVAKANWSNPAEIKRQFGGTVDFVGDNRVIFDLGGNKYRLVVHYHLRSAACS